MVEKESEKPIKTFQQVHKGNCKNLQPISKYWLEKPKQTNKRKSIICSLSELNIIDLSIYIYENNFDSVESKQDDLDGITSSVTKSMRGKHTFHNRQTIWGNGLGRGLPNEWV